MADIELRFGKDVLVIDGAMGTMLQQMDISTDECVLLLNVLDPEVIIDIHKRYIAAGAYCVTSNTFEGTRAKLALYGLEDRAEELNRAGVRNARQAGAQHVLAGMGPCGLLMQPFGEASFEDVFEQFFEQVTALAKEGPDAILIETMTEISEARCAVLAAKAACDLPVMVSCTFGANGRMDLSGTDPATAAYILEGVGADVIGMNCGLGPRQLLPLFKQMAEAASVPLLVQPNAGIPYLDQHGNTIFPGTAEEMAETAVSFRSLGAQLIGSCCGSNPVFTAVIHALVGDTDVIRRPGSKAEKSMVLTSLTKSLRVGPGFPVRVIGERINPTGKPHLTEELERGSMSLVRQFAEQQELAGADLLDINVGAALVDATVVLPAAIQALIGFTSCPLVLDTTDFDALEAALRLYPGRALINSVNGDPQSYGSVFPLAKKYGAGVIVLALDREGVPKTLDARMAIVQRVREAAHANGLNDYDLLIDMLTMTAATDPQAPLITLQAVSRAEELGFATVLGVSNVSHGLPSRSELNAAFVAAAITAGLSAALVNPNDEAMIQTIKSCGSVAAITNLEHSTKDEIRLKHAIAAWDIAYRQAMSKAAEGTDRLIGEVVRADSSSSTQLPGEAVEEDPLGNSEALMAEAGLQLKRAILRGDHQAMSALVDAAIASGFAAESLVDTLLAPTLNDLGTAFERGEAFLPQMMVAAEAMKAAVTRIRDYLPQNDDNNHSGKVLFCSVKGDVHSIGKDICIALLESQGFLVYDLGVDVEPEMVLASIREHDVDIVCLSALMTTTLTAMKQTVELIYREEPRFREASDKAVLVGGAVVTQRWSDAMGAIYSADAPGCVEKVRQICMQNV
ncbi:MAG: dihydropteroate synthase [Coriobacteriaceae bacterium]|nr:dihydropteroate synthase [Coriobacteriaceae bacterium]